MSKKISMQEVADKLNISKVTVHKVLNGKTDVSLSMREKVMQTCVELGYEQIDPLAKHCRLFYFLISKEFYHSGEQYYSNIFNKLYSMFFNLGITISMRFIDDSFDANKFIANCKRFEPNFGIFIAGPADKNALTVFENQRIPCVVIDYVSESLNLGFIFIDNYRAGFKLTNYLIEMGYKRILAVIDTTKSESNLDKYYGFRKSLSKHGIEFTSSMHVNTDLSKANALHDFVLPTPLPEAILFECDLAAYNFYIYAISQNIRLPEDIAIASFDNTDLTLDMKPQLTSIGPNVDDILRQCHDIMLKNFTTGANKNRVVTVYSVLHKRGSVKSKN